MLRKSKSPSNIQLEDKNSGKDHIDQHGNRKKDTYDMKNNRNDELVDKKSLKKNYPAIFTENMD